MLTGARLLYVGRIDANKNILPLLRGINSLGAHLACFTVVGDGPLWPEVQRLARSHPKIKVLGRLGNHEARMMMREHDYLVLPSLYDGWGAVVNEALSVGTRVLCSEACGASILLDGRTRGAMFSRRMAETTIREWTSHGEISASDRMEIRAWAQTHISGTVAAEYFLRVMRGESCTAPWLTAL